MLPLLTLAAASKVPFYIAGLMLAGWAVVLSVIGLTQPTFPASLSAQRGVIAISLVLMIAAIAMAITTA